MDHKMTTRAALGRMGSVGDLYDARTDNFCGLPIFKKAIPPSALTLLDSHSSDIHLMHSDTFSEKFSKMDINAELSVSVLAGLFALEGSGRYLNDKKKSSRTLKSSLIYKIQTNDESVSIYNEDLKDAYSLDAIGNRMATHLVTGISWGANLVVSCMYGKKDNRDETKIEGSLSAQLKKLSLSISGKAQVEFGEGENDNDIKFDVRIFGDILPKNGDLPTTFEGALALMRQLPSLVADCNAGKGKPLTYRLVPIELIQNYLKLDMIIDTSMKSLEKASFLQVVNLFDQMTGAQQKLNAFHEDVSEHKFCVSDEDMSKISALKFDMELEESRIRSKLSSYLIQVRSGEKSATELEEFIRDFRASPNSPQNVGTLLQGWKPIQDKMSFAATLLENGATYVGLNTSLDDELIRNFDSKLLVLYFNSASKSIDSPRLIGNLMIFSEEIKKKVNGYRYYAVDCDFHPHLLPQGMSSCVQIMEKGKCVTEDLLGELNKGTSSRGPQDDVQDETNGSTLVENDDNYENCHFVDAPVLEPPAPNPIIRWVAARDAVVPPKALRGGYEGFNPIYVARARHERGIIPGQLRWSGCYISWGNEEHRKDEYEVLVTSEVFLDWVATTGSSIPESAVPGGITESGEILYIGRARYKGCWKSGRVQKSYGMCLVGNFGKE